MTVTACIILLLLPAAASFFIAKECTLDSGMKVNVPVTVCVTELMSAALLLRHGPGVAALKCILLVCILLYASLHDIAKREVPDCAWVCVMFAALIDLDPARLPAMVFGALAVFLPQMCAVLIKTEKPFGGADIKMSSALGFMFGGFSGLGTVCLALTVSLAVMLIRRKKKGRDCGLPLIPFISGAALIPCFI